MLSGLFRLRVEVAGRMIHRPKKWPLPLSKLHGLTSKKRRSVVLTVKPGLHRLVFHGR